MLQIDYDSQLDPAQHRFMDRISEPDSSNVMVAWWKMGTGKTRLALHVFWRSDFTDMIVVCRRIAFGDWIDEMELCGMNYLVYGDDYKGDKILKLASYKTGEKPKRVLLLSAGDLKNIPLYFPKGQLLVVDELYLFSNPKAKRTILLKQMSLFCSARVGLSGTIMPARNNMAIFGQLSALNAERTLASGSTEFQRKFQSKGKGRFGVEYTNRPGSDEEIAALIGHMVDIHMPEGRPTRRQIMKVDKTPEQARAVRMLKKEYEWKNREYEYALQIVNVVNGISNGWWINQKFNAAGELVSEHLEHYKSTKVEKLLVLLDDLVAAGERVVVWCAYHNDIARIASELKHPWLEFTARVPFDKAKWEAGKVQIVLATEANGSSVNHFKHVKYAVYFSINFKLLDLEQSMTRHERKGSSHDGAHYYFLQTRGTGDARAYQLVTESRETEQSLVTTLASEIFK